jgi:hypothetical protein
MSDCGVCLSGWDGDGHTEFCTQVKRKARKPHICSECKKQIAVGETYEHAAGKSEGEMWAFNTCLICSEIAETFYCEGRLFGGMLWEEMREVAFPAFTTGYLDRLTTAAAKQEVTQRWNEWKFGRVQP